MVESKAVQREICYRVLYQGYLERETRQIERLAEADKVRIPPELDFGAIPGLKHESAQKMARVRPYSLGQAGRISGVSPADVSILMIYLTKRSSSQPEHDKPAGRIGPTGTGDSP
jgi:tRNA uridine 5-carboxymethylaminomethyl modification enzyme